MPIKLDSHSFHFLPEYPSNKDGDAKGWDEKSCIIDKGVEPDVLPDGGVGGEEDDSGEGMAKEPDASGKKCADDVMLRKESGKAHDCEGDGIVQKKLQGVDEVAASEE